MEHTGLTGTYFGALGFTKPLEQLVLCTVPLQSLLDWLSKPKGPNLVEASVAVAPEKALVLAITKKMLYGEKLPLVEVGLVYKPHYVSVVSFSAAYMQLCKVPIMQSAFYRNYANLYRSPCSGIFVRLLHTERALFFGECL